MELIKSLLLVISLLTISLVKSAYSRSRLLDTKPCNSEVYCWGDLLHTVQMFRDNAAMPWLHKDSKTFVDRPLKFQQDVVLENYKNFKDEFGDKLNRTILTKFVNDNFELNSTEFEDWDPDDWFENPPFLQKINDTKLRDWAATLHAFWFELGRNITEDVYENPEKYSMVYVPYPVIVPGGRFKEFYYWDSYWIQEGLLLSEMNKTVKGMISNFVYMVNTIGFVPNGGRIYYQRSQPPFLIPMVKNYLDKTQDFTFLQEILPTLDKEFDFWIQNRAVTVKHHSRDYRMIRYDSQKCAPRPESYREDYELAEKLPTEEEKCELYYNLHAGAESGWDFSSKWFMPYPSTAEPGSLMDLKTRNIIPAELNALMYYNAEMMAAFHNRTGNQQQYNYYKNVATEFRAAINAVLWDDTLGSWFDYDMLTNTLRKEFFPTNIVPLWAGVHTSNDMVKKVLNYLKNSGATEFISGVPSSMVGTGQQWDFPNGWAPSQSMLIQGLQKTQDPEAQELAFQLAQKWIRTNFKAFYESEPNHMYEKYDVTVDGHPGGGGEYDVVIGFGWTNGVVLDFLNTYGDRLVAPQNQTNPGTSGSSIPVFTSFSAVLISLSLLLTTIWG